MCTTLYFYFCLPYSVLTPQNSVSIYHHLFQFSSVSHVQLCDPMNHSTPGLPVHHQLPEFIQTQVHWVCDAIQPSHPLLPPLLLPQSLPASGSFTMSQLFACGGRSTGVSASASVLPVNTQDWSLGCTGWISLQSKRLKSLLRHHSSKSFLTPPTSSFPSWEPLFSSL